MTINIINVLYDFFIKTELVVHKDCMDEVIFLYEPLHYAAQGTSISIRTDNCQLLTATCNYHNLSEHIGNAISVDINSPDSIDVLYKFVMTTFSCKQ